MFFFAPRGPKTVFIFNLPGSRDDERSGMCRSHVDATVIAVFDERVMYVGNIYGCLS